MYLKSNLIFCGNERSNEENAAIMAGLALSGESCTTVQIVNSNNKRKLN